MIGLPLRHWEKGEFERIESYSSQGFKVKSEAPKFILAQVFWKSLQAVDKLRKLQRNKVTILLDKKVLNILHTGGFIMNEDKAAVIAKEILTFIYEHALRLEWNEVHAAIQDGVRDIIVKNTERK